MPKMRLQYLYPIATKKKAKKLLRKGYSSARVKTVLNLNCSRSSINRWKSQSFSRKSVADRAQNKVHSFLTQQESDVFAGFIVKLEEKEY